MNARERYIQTLRFGAPDRIPFMPGGGRKSTLKRWRQEGLPADQDPLECLVEQLGIDAAALQGTQALDADSRMRPAFEEKVLEHKDGHYIVQDWKGNVCEIADTFDVSYLRDATDFVTRRWIKCPVETRDDWEAMKSRYDLDTPGRFPADYETRWKTLKDRDWPLVIGVNGPFWQLREWCGFEGLCMLMIDEPEWVAEMADFWMRFVAGMLERILPHVVPDSLHISEDMAYKAKSMISMDMAREFCMPSWVQWSRQVKGAGMPLVDIDSDGYIGELIPLWIEAGVNVCDPIEVAAHCDIVDFRRLHGHRMAYRQGIDKRCIAAGGDRLRDELRRIEPVVRDGGFIPGCDHGVPSDVSWRHFTDYCRQIAQMTGWL